MDSDDEQMLNKEDEDFRRGLLKRVPPKPPLFIRYYEEEEFAAQRRRIVMRNRGFPINENDIDDMGGMWRIRRLWKSVVGFYKGELDLAGRSERRWRSLNRHLDELLQDIRELREHVVESPPVPVDDNGSFAVLLAVAPASIFRNFKKRHRLGYVDLGEILPLPETVVEAISGLTGPVFQKVFLKDLPPELLLRVFDLAHIHDCRALGLTCQAFHELSLTYVYLMRRLVLRVDPNFVSKRSDELDEIDQRYLCQLKSTMRNRLLADFRFLLSRPDILKRVQNMHIQNLWTEPLQVAASIRPYDVPAVEHFYSPIYRQIVATLSMATHLQAFHLDNYDITKEMLQAMASLNALHTVIVQACSIEELPDLETLPMLPAVLNLTLVPEHIPGYEMVQLVVLFPNMRCLSVAGMPRGGFCTLPYDEFRQQCNPFRTLERANFAHIDDDDVPILFEWILAAGQATPLRLTHFRLELECGLQADELTQLLLALTGAPLRVLALEGVAHVDDGLFTRLAGAFPALTALTLIHRQNLMQTTSRPSQWPGTTGEYARALAAFPALRHFMWNFYIWPLRCGTTFDLALAEAGYPTALGLEECEENCHEADWDILPRLFCAYCPRLETLVFSLLHIALMEFTIVRSADGGVLLRRYREMASSEQFEKNNPMLSLLMTFENPWHIVPSARKSETRTSA